MSPALQSADLQLAPLAIEGQMAAVLRAAGVAPLVDTGWIRVTGPDATRWLNGMVTNNVQSLQPGEGCYNFLLNAQGRIQGDCTIYRDPLTEKPEFLLETDTSQIDAIQQHLDHFIIMDDVELADIQRPAQRTQPGWTAGRGLT